MSGKTDTIFGRAKQAIGAVTGNKKMKRKGQAQEDKGELKGKFDSVVDKTQGKIEDVKKTVNRA